LVGQQLKYWGVD